MPAVDIDPALRFAAVRRADFPLISAWLRTPHVARWWADDPSPEAIENDYGGRVDGSEPSEVFIVHADGASVGLVQRYRYDAYPAYADQFAPIMPIPAGAYSIDYFVGPPEVLHKGLGTAMIRAFTASLWRDHPEASCIIVPVNARNRGSRRVLEGAGFIHVASGELTPDNPIDDPLHLVYRIDRPLVSAASAVDNFVGN